MKNLVLILCCCVMCAVSNAALTAHYEMDGDPNDSSVNGYDGFLNAGSTAVWDPTSANLDGNNALGGSLDLTNSANWVDCNDVPVTNAATIAFWMKANAMGNYEPLAKFPNDASGQGFVVKLRSGGGVRFRVGSNGSKTDVMSDSHTGVVYAAGQWVHLAFVYEKVGGATSVDLYVNGQPHTQRTSTTTRDISAAAGTSLYIGAAVDVATGEAFKGSMDDVRIYDHTLSAVEISVLPGIPLNTPPSVDAGGHATLETITANALAGSYTDDGFPEGGPVTIAWSSPQEPNVVFDNPNILNPNVTFDATGIYELKLEVNDGELTGSDSIYVHAKDGSLFNTLQAHWKFDDASDVDDYYYNYTSITGTPAFNEPNAIKGKCLALDAGEYLEFGTTVGTESAMSIVFWAMPGETATSTSSKGVVSKYPAGTDPLDNGWTIQWRSDDELRCRIGDTYDGGGGDNIVNETGLFAKGQWVHVAATFDGTTTMLYVNGELKGTDTTSKGSFDPIRTFQIGDNNWAGLLDEMYLYDYPIDQNAVRALYTQDGGNLPPQVTADDNLIKGTVSVAVPLSMTIVDEDTTASATWTVVDQPVSSIVTIDSVVIGAGTASCLATFDTIGDYTLTASATDSGGLTGTSSEFVVKVRSVGFDGLEAHFDFESDYSSTAGDVTYTGAAVGGASQTAGAGIGGSGGLVLDGTTGHLDFNAYLGAEAQITVAFWAKADSAGLGTVAQHIIQKWANDSSGAGWMTRIRNDDFNYAVLLGSAFSSGGYVAAPLGLPNAGDTWNHYAFTFDGTLFNIYQDGVLVNSNPSAYSPADVVTPLVMGYRSNNSSSFFDGVIDEVRIYDYALTQAQIVSVVTGDGGTLPTTCLSEAMIADFNFDCYVDIEDLVYLSNPGQWLVTMDLNDFVDLAATWLDCVDPSDAGCL